MVLSHDGLDLLSVGSILPCPFDIRSIFCAFIIGSLSGLMCINRCPYVRTLSKCRCYFMRELLAKESRYLDVLVPLETLFNEMFFAHPWSY